MAAIHKLCGVRVPASRHPDKTRAAVLLSALLLAILLGAAGAAAQDDTSTTRVTEIDSLVVTGAKQTAGLELRPVTDEDIVAEVLLNSPFQMIRRGTSCASDLYADGFKRNDITFTVDGERFTTACPNRMDTRVGQVDLLDIESVNLSRNGAGLQSGLGGMVDFRRRRPGDEALVYGQLAGTRDHAEDVDARLSIEGKQMRFGVRYRHGEPYTDADDRTYTDMYNYAQAPAYSIFEIRGHKAFADGDVQVAWEESENILFPYLLMDERTNDHWQVSGSYKGHRIYFNRTEHLMDNALRTSFNMTDMVTDANNTMVGAVGGFYEVYARNWNADNKITPIANPAMGKTNHMLPDVWRIGASVRHEIGDTDNPWLHLRAGIARTKVGDEDQLDMYKLLQADAELSKWSIPFGVTVTHSLDLTERHVLAVSGEVSADAPSIEMQYVAVDKPGTKPDWIGNPNLKDPLRATARAAVSCEHLRFEVFGTRIWNYPTMVKRMEGGAPYQTYEGIEALMAGASLSASWKLIKAGVNWNWGEKTADKNPLAEIQPVTFNLAAYSPKFGSFRGRVLYQHAAGQDRVDASLDEETTGAWNRLDLGLTLEQGNVTYKLDADNVTNSLYTQHLSYLRSPFASGVRVFEPGRTYRLTAAFSF